MATLLDRLKGNVDVDSSDPQEERIPVHYFFASLVGLADGQVTRGQIETKWSIGTTGTDQTQLDAIINGYIAAADKGRYVDAVHAIFMWVESGEDLTATEINDWLTAAQVAY